MNDTRMTAEDRMIFDQGYEVGYKQATKDLFDKMRKAWEDRGRLQRSIQERDDRDWLGTAAARREGMEAMRERAAITAKVGWEDSVDQVMRAIRALPVDE